MYSTAQFSYHRDNKGNKSLVGELSTLRIPPGAGFPNTVTIKSHHTGKVATFVKDHVAAERNEFWDGELYEYLSQDTDTQLVLLND